MKDILLTDKEFWNGLRYQKTVKRNVKLVLLILSIFTFGYFSKQNNEMFWNLITVSVIYLPLYLLYRVLLLEVYTIKVKHEQSDVLNYVYSSSDIDDMIDITGNLRQTFEDHEFKYYKNGR